MKDLVQKAKAIKANKAERAISLAIECLEDIEAWEHDEAEAAHCEAEQILLELLIELGAGEVSKKYEEVRDRIGFWYS